MSTTRQACVPLELEGGGAVRVALAGRIGFLMVENESRQPLRARVSVDPLTETVMIVVDEDGARSCRC